MSDLGVFRPSGTDAGADAGLWRANVVRDFARSELFDRIFREGMELVEETAAYLDGPGRQESKSLNRRDALGYAGESMRLTTRLMQVASWLLVQRAVREGDMEAAAACDARYRLSPEPTDPAEPGEGLPLGLSDLLERSERLHDRVTHLDQRMFLDAAEDDLPHPVLSQHDKLRAAFGV